MSVQAIRNKAKSQIHKAFSLECDYFPVGSVLAIPALVRRYEEEPILIGDLGGSTGWADRTEQPIYMVFSDLEVSPSRGDRVIYSGTEYHIDIVLKTINGYTSCEVVTA